MKGVTILIMLVPLVCLADDTNPPPGEETSSQQKSPSVWMQQKLQHSQKIFAALTEGDLTTVDKIARQMKVINQLEALVRGRSDPYRTQLRLFRFANDEIIRGAQEKNLERVTLGYTQLSVSCVMCHKHLRQTKRKETADRARR